MAFDQDLKIVYKFMENTKCGIKILGSDCSGFLYSAYCLHVPNKTLRLKKYMSFHHQVEIITAEMGSVGTTS